VLQAPTLWALVERRAESTPDALALADEDDRRLTFAGFRDRALRAAAGLSELGVEPGDTVAWQMPTWIETVVLMVALSRLGARQMPLLPIYRERELSVCLGEGRPRLACAPARWRGTDYPDILARAAATAGLDRLRVVACDRALPDGDPGVLPPPPEAEDGTLTRWIYFTSGTTSTPKGALHTDRSVMASGRSLAERQGITGRDHFGIAFPFTHIGGLNNLCTALSCGCALVVTESFDPPVTASVFAHHGVSIVGGGPAFYQAFLDLQRAQPDTPVLPDLRFMSGGGAPMPPELHRAIRREIGGRGCAHGYGMTEACVVATNSPADDDDRLAHTVGKPVTGVEVRVVGTDGSVTPTGDDGEVQIRGPLVFSGYLREADNRDVFDGAWFRTGDLGHFDREGYLTITGRTKDIIIRKGENISAKELEDLLYAHPKVAEVAIVGLPDAARGELVCAVVRPRDADDPFTFADMELCCRQASLMRQKFPERLVLVDDLPRNPAGKVLKTELRSRLAAETSAFPLRR
jgi:acyl-CoA synthetase (AMP-forming)/AMP-acid ligase II